jgi:large subunit ribosomal protein L25
MITLEVKNRDAKANLFTLRNEGSIPAVFYGPKEKSTPIAVSSKDFEKALKMAGESTIVVLKGDFGEHEALIHDLDRDPVTDVIRHADFYVVEKGKKIKVGVPIEFIGVSPAVKDLGGVLVKVIHEVEIEALPKDLPHSLEADISALVNFESQILASDIKLPSGVELVTKADEVIALTSMPKEEKEEEAAPMDLSAIEVEKKGKTEEEGEAGGDDAKKE